VVFRRIFKRRINLKKFKSVGVNVQISEGCEFTEPE
jgi:hypothetical protein